MKKFLSGKKAMALGVVAALVVATAAYAYWTANGTGTGTGAVAADGGSLSISGAVDDALVPGGSSDITLKAWNTNTSALQVGEVTLDTGGITTDKAGCDPAWFTYTAVTNSTVVDGNTAEADADVLPAKASISMSNPTDVNQDACKGATISLDLKSTSIPTP